MAVIYYRMPLAPLYLGRNGGQGGEGLAKADLSRQALAGPQEKVLLGLWTQLP